MRWIVGWLVAMAYVVSGRRRRSCRRIREENLIVPVALHGPSPKRLAAILKQLDRLVGLDRVEITFDDGRKILKECVPVLEKFGVKSIWFVSPGEILKGCNWAERAKGRKRLDIDRLARMSVAEREQELLLAGVDLTGGDLLTIEDIRELAQNPLIEFGNHTWNHISCTGRPKAEVMDEIGRTQRQLAEWTGKVPTAFAYPFGHGRDDLDAAIREMGMVPYSLKPGFVTAETRGRARNLAYERYSLAEDIGRLLTAWPCR